MKRIRPILVMLLVLPTSCSDPYAEYTLYGGGVKTGPALDVASLVESAEELNGRNVVVEGTAGSVCQNRGCWMYVTDGEEKVRITFKDYSFFVPIGSEGKRVRAEGILQLKMVDKETLQHWEEEADGGDSSRITEDQTVIMLEASGILIEGGGSLSPDQIELMEQG